MQIEKSRGIIVEPTELFSDFLQRTVKIDYYLPEEFPKAGELNVLLVNDGQDLVTMQFDKISNQLYESGQIKPLLCVGIHCGEDRRNEYGMIVSPDYKGRGAKARQYQQFILEELLPVIYSRYKLTPVSEFSFAGFSLGALSAMDLAWNNPNLFKKVGVFSGSLWWRTKDRAEKDFNEFTDRLMHQQIRNAEFREGMKFFFQCGELDEEEDRNRNGVIDSIDDTIDIMKELLAKGYMEGRDMAYLQLPDGRHDVPSWARAFPSFLKWGWGLEHN